MKLTPSVERLYTEGTPLLRVIAIRVARQVGGAVELDDSMSFGRPALLEAAQTFDPEQATFTTYASRKIRWAILDGVRRETHGRSTVARAMALIASMHLSEASAAQADRDDDGPPQPEEVYQHRLTEMLAHHAMALALGLCSGGERGGGVETPEENAVRSNLRETIRGAITGLPERERALIERHYYQDEQFETIASDLGISKSRASRLHSGAIVMLQAALRE